MFNRKDLLSYTGILLILVQFIDILVNNSTFQKFKTEKTETDLTYILDKMNEANLIVFGRITMKKPADEPLAA